MGITINKKEWKQGWNQSEVHGCMENTNCHTTVVIITHYHHPYILIKLVTQKQ